MPRDSASGLAPSEPAQALFKTVNRFVPQLDLLGVPIIVISLAVVDVVCAIIEQRAVNRSFNKIIERRFRQCRRKGKRAIIVHFATWAEERID